MPSLVNRAREVTSSESDDFFSDDTILFYLNKVQQRIVSSLLRIEERENKSIRALDNLRQTKGLSVNGLTFTNQGDYFSAEVQFPSSPDEINQFMFLMYDTSGVMRELNYNNRLKLEWGNLSPTDDELYYMINRDSGDNIIFEIFTNTDDSATSKEVKVYYILDPTDLVLSDTSMSELPVRLENALINGAAEMMVSQESINDEKAQNATQIFSKKYVEELRNNAY